MFKTSVRAEKDLAALLGTKRSFLTGFLRAHRNCFPQLPDALLHRMLAAVSCCRWAELSCLKIQQSIWDPSLILSFKTGSNDPWLQSLIVFSNKCSHIFQGTLGESRIARASDDCSARRVLTFVKQVICQTFYWLLNLLVKSFIFVSFPILSKFRSIIHFPFVFSLGKLKLNNKFCS
jgi:hypothetical protein